MHLMPDQNLGFFVSYNSAGKGEGSPRTILWQSFLNRYFSLHPVGRANGRRFGRRRQSSYWHLLVESPLRHNPALGDFDV